MAATAASHLAWKHFLTISENMELTHLLGVLQKCDCRFLVIPFCCGVEIHSNDVPKNVCEITFRFRHFKRKLFLPQRGRKQKVTMGRVTEAGLSQEVRGSSGARTRVRVQPCRTGLVVRSPLGRSAEGFLCGRLAPRRRTLT